MTGAVKGRSGCCLSARHRTPLVFRVRVSPVMKTRTLIVLALLCGMALLIAFTVQILLAG